MLAFGVLRVGSSQKLIEARHCFLDVQSVKSKYSGASLVEVFMGQRSPLELMGVRVIKIDYRAW